jgi:hypothetical protein
MKKTEWHGKRVAIAPCPALGDVTIYLRLAWLFHLAGAEVRFLSSLLKPAEMYFSWLKVESSERVDLLHLCANTDLVICYINWLTCNPDLLDRVVKQRNICFVTAKKLPAPLQLDGRDVVVGSDVFRGASRALCQDSHAGLTMVTWVDAYASSVFGLQSDLPVAVDLPKRCSDSRRRVAIFPTTPHEKKNYAPRGFRWLAQRLQRQGWLVEIVGMPHEGEILHKRFQGFSIRTFPNVRELMDFLVTCSAVISNDSGGGHLGSLLGLQSFTVTRKHADFVWRPGFNAGNEVLAPVISFKLLGRYIWRPFIPIWRISKRLGYRP